jgi:hypothetical protein
MIPENPGIIVQRPTGTGDSHWFPCGSFQLDGVRAASIPSKTNPPKTKFPVYQSNRSGESFRMDIASIRKL